MLSPWGAILMTSLSANSIVSSPCFLRQVPDTTLLSSFGSSAGSDPHAAASNRTPGQPLLGERWRPVTASTPPASRTQQLRDFSNIRDLPFAIAFMGSQKTGAAGLAAHAMAAQSDAGRYISECSLILQEAALTRWRGLRWACENCFARRFGSAVC